MSTILEPIRPLLDRAYADAKRLTTQNAGVISQVKLAREQASTLIERNRKLQFVVDGLQKTAAAGLAEQSRLREDATEKRKAIGELEDKRDRLNKQCALSRARVEDFEEDVAAVDHELTALLSIVETKKVELATSMTNIEILSSALKLKHEKIQAAHSSIGTSEMACEQARRTEREAQNANGSLAERLGALQADLSRVERERDGAITRLEAARATLQSSRAQEMSLVDARASAERAAAASLAQARGLENECATAQAAVRGAASELDHARAVADQQHAHADTLRIRLQALADKRSLALEAVLEAEAEAARAAEEAQAARQGADSIAKEIQAADAKLLAAQARARMSIKETADKSNLRERGAQVLALLPVNVPSVPSMADVARSKPPVQQPAVSAMVNDSGADEEGDSTIGDMRAEYAARVSAAAPRQIASPSPHVMTVASSPVQTGKSPVASSTAQQVGEVEMVEKSGRGKLSKKRRRESSATRLKCVDQVRGKDTGGAREENCPLFATQPVTLSKAKPASAKVTGRPAAAKEQAQAKGSVHPIFNLLSNGKGAPGLDVVMGIGSPEDDLFAGVGLGSVAIVSVASLGLNASSAGSAASSAAGGPPRTATPTSNPSDSVPGRANAQEDASMDWLFGDTGLDMGIRHSSPRVQVINPVVHKIQRGGERRATGRT